MLDDRTEPVDPDAASSLLAHALPITELPWDAAARSLRARVALMRQLEGDAWPDWLDAALDRDREWLARAAHGQAGLARIDLAAALRAMLPWSAATRLDEKLPSHLGLPGGRAAIDYLAEVPLASAKAQAFYGLAETPLLAGGRVKLRLALLSPAGRPVAITADLAAFWSGGWIDVRKEMRGRYPRHHWPDDPQRLPQSTREANSRLGSKPGPRR